MKSMSKKFPRNLSKRKIRIRKTKTSYSQDYYTTSPSQEIDQTIKRTIPEHRNNQTNTVRPSRSWISQGQRAQRRLDWTIQSALSSFACPELDQYRNVQSRLRNPPLRVSVELSLVSSRS
ncbi:hypothetical protein F2Q70_00020910 [Brassica cretica]|uniref:Uncharacterized protein n=2 Tax=Brassica cretica TaxID=69181 RepID=A0A8S9GN94_BRACR|nr:hypothetical protein F2Q70_00020910 [Brassica cretica]KAF2556673.1 hypothetical protein F2Q68_00014373 [Brassica cretica]KAF3605500.1 hypothetical protein DY000_02046850 [Brassica cretica]